VDGSIVLVGEDTFCLLTVACRDQMLIAQGDPAGRCCSTTDPLLGKMGRWGSLVIMTHDGKVTQIMWLDAKKVGRLPGAVPLLIDPELTFTLQTIAATTVLLGQACEAARNGW
jgi:hypothetical protein